jgi:hypothetical protein
MAGEIAASGSSLAETMTYVMEEGSIFYKLKLKNRKESAQFFNSMVRPKYASTSYKPQNY